MTDTASWPPGSGPMAEKVRSFDWSRTTLGPIASWPPELRTATAIVLEGAFPAALIWGPGLVTLYNDSFRPILGDKPEALGRSFADIWAEAWPEIGPLVDQAFAGQAIFIEDFPLVVHRSREPEQAYFTFSYSPVRAGDGAVLGMIDTVVETTARVRDSLALAQSEQRFRAFVTASSDVVYRVSPDWSRMHQVQRRGFLTDTAEPKTDWMERYIPPDDRDLVRRAIDQAIGAKSRFEIEHRVLRADGTVGWALSRSTPILDDKGDVVEWLGAASDVTDRKLAEESLREREERLRRIVENARDYAIFTTDPEGRVEDWYEGAAAVFGWRADEIHGQSMDITFTPEDVAEGAPQREREIAAQEGVAPNVRWHMRKDGSRVFIEGVTTALHDAEGGLIGFLKIGQDTTRRRRAQEHEQFLVAELQHRVRNTLGVVRSIARRTAERSATVEDMFSHFQGRLDAFSRVQAVVTRNPEAGVDLESLIEDELLAHAAREGEALTVEGPEVCLTPRAAESISLAIHELTTNAVKYGALSAAAGRVAVRWERAAHNGGEQLRLVWEETGLDLPAEPPERHGFGLEVLQRSLPYDLRAETRVDFRQEGLRFEMEMPLGADVLAAGDGSG